MTFKQSVLVCIELTLALFAMLGAEIAAQAGDVGLRQAFGFSAIITLAVGLSQIVRICLLEPALKAAGK